MPLTSEPCLGLVHGLTTNYYVPSKPTENPKCSSIFTEALSNAKLDNGLMLAPISQLSDRDALSQVADFLLLLKM